jgi:TIR domain
LPSNELDRTSMEAGLSSIFLSYRRTDSADIAGRIRDCLVAHFGRHRVFKDVDSIPIAVEFRKHIQEQIRQSVVVVLIGPTWASSEMNGIKRLHDTEDFVRMEIETALDLKLPVIPTLVTNAIMPSKDILPDSIRMLTSLQDMQVRPDPDFHTDIKSAIFKLEQLIQPIETTNRPPHRFLQELSKNCQDWYNEIIHALADIRQLASDFTINSLTRDRQIEKINFLYVNTRTYLPRVLAARRLLASFSGAETLAEAVDEFLKYIVLGTAAREDSSEYRKPFLVGTHSEESFKIAAAHKFEDAVVDFPPESILLDPARVALDRAVEEITRLSYL